MTRDRNPPPRPAALLHLPPHLRRRIYILVGLARRDGPDAYPYTYYLDGRKESRWCVSEFDPPPARDFAGLLLACRALYAEAAALLYSANRFVIFYSSKGSLGPLRALSPLSLAFLASLKIVLRESSCHRPVDSCSYPTSCCCVGREDDMAATSFHCARHHGSLHRRPLLASDPASIDLPAVRAIFAEWHDVALYLASRVGAGRLELSLVCDVDPGHADALEVARLAVAPLASFPPLRACHIRLGKLPNRPLQRLAEDTVLRARPTTSPLGLTAPRGRPSLLLSLPPELRHYILQYTDLITPWREVTWCRQERGYQLWPPPCTAFEGGGCPPYIHHGCPLRRCSPWADEPSVPAVGCFCRRRHAAFSLTCRCWAPPTDLFLVCRLLCRDAQFVFFSGNRFVIHDSHVPPWPWDLPSPESTPPPGPDAETAHDAATTIADNNTNDDNNNNNNLGRYPHPRLAASEFLRAVVPRTCLPHLRSLELVFPPYDPRTWPRAQHPALIDWRATVAGWIRDGSGDNAAVLTIRVVALVLAPRHLALTEGQARRVREGLARVVSPLRDLLTAQVLRALRVEPAFPPLRTPETLRYVARHGWGWLEELEEEVRALGEVEVEVEVEVEASEGDDEASVVSGSSLSSHEGEQQPRESVWLRWLDVIT